MFAALDFPEDYATAMKRARELLAELAEVRR